MQRVPRSMGLLVLALHVFQTTSRAAQIDYVALALGAFASWVGVPGPGEPLLIAAGIVAAKHKLDIKPVLLWAWVGATARRDRRLAGRADRRAQRDDRPRPAAAAAPKAVERGEEVFHRLTVIAILLAPSWVAGIHRGRDRGLPDHQHGERRVVGGRASVSARTTRGRRCSTCSPTSARAPRSGCGLLVLVGDRVRGDAGGAAPAEPRSSVRGLVPDQRGLWDGTAGAPTSSWIAAWGTQRDRRGGPSSSGLPLTNAVTLPVALGHLRPAERLAPLVEEVAQRVDPLGGRLDVDDAVGGVGVQPVDALAARRRTGPSGVCCATGPTIPIAAGQRARTARRRTPAGASGCGRRAARPARTGSRRPWRPGRAGGGRQLGPSLERDRPRARAARSRLGGGGRRAALVVLVLVARLCRRAAGLV